MEQINVADADKICELLCTHSADNVELAKQLFEGLCGWRTYSEWDFLEEYYSAFLGHFSREAFFSRGFEVFSGLSFKDERLKVRACDGFVFPKHTPKWFSTIEIEGISWQSHTKAKFLGVGNTTISTLSFKGSFIHCDDYSTNKLPSFGGECLPNIKTVYFNHKVCLTNSLINQLPDMPNLEGIVTFGQTKLADRFKNVNIQHL